LLLKGVIKINRFKHCILYTQYYISKSKRVSAMSANDSSASLKYAPQFALDHNSIRFETPLITHSLRNEAYVLNGCGIFTRPCLSTSHSTAPEKKNRVNARASFFLTGNCFNFSSNCFHSFIG